MGEPSNLSTAAMNPGVGCRRICKLQRDHAADKLLTHHIDIGEGEGEGVPIELSLSFLRENPNKLYFIESCLRIFVTG